MSMKDAMNPGIRKADVEIGGRFIAKVSGKLVKVRITAESSYGGWNAVNEESGRAIRIRSARRLRRRVKQVRCGECENCRTLIMLKPTWFKRYKAAKKALAEGSLNPDSWTPEQINAEWRRMCDESPCMGPKEI